MRNQYLASAALAVLACCLTFYVGLNRVTLNTGDLGLSSPPELASDDADYDNIAFNLFKFNKFQFNWEDNEWRSRYEQFNDNGTYDNLLGRSGVALTTHYPPLLPLVVSIGYRIVGPDFAVPRILNLIFMSLAVGSAVFFAGVIAGISASVITIGIVFLHSELFRISGQVFTESLATLLFTLSVISTYYFMQSVRTSRKVSQLTLAVTSGALWGLLILARSIFAFWVPIILILIFLHAVFILPRGARRNYLQCWALLFTSAVIVLAPWSARNSIATGHFSPLGTQGSEAIVGGYSDGAVERGGQWDSRSYLSLYYEYESLTHERTTFPAEYEYNRGQYIQSSAIQWARDHWYKIPYLAFGKIKDHHFSYFLPLPRFAREVNLLLALLMILGSLSWLTKPSGFIFSGFLACDLIVIALTYSADGRYLIPLIPMIGVATSGLLFLPQLLRKILR